MRFGGGAAGGSRRCVTDHAPFRRDTPGVSACRAQTAHARSGSDARRAQQAHARANAAVARMVPTTDSGWVITCRQVKRNTRHPSAVICE